VAAGLAQRLAGDEQARAFEQALLDRLLEAGSAPPAAPPR
jgi:hypothetical protein